MIRDGRKILLLTFALVLEWSAGAAVFYVDATLGNDDYDGSLPTNVVGTIKGPRRTLAAALALTTAQSEDVVYAAAGTYDDGETRVAETMNFRAVVPEGVALIGAGSDVTIIKGRSDPDTANGCGPNALLGVYLKGTTAKKPSFLKGFSVLGGRALASDYSNNGGGIQCADNSSVIDGCVIDDCIGYRGGALRNGHYFNCTIGTKNVALYTAPAGIQANLFVNCLFKNGGFYGQGVNPINFINCTFLTSAPWNNYTTIGLSDGFFFRNCLLNFAPHTRASTGCIYGCAFNCQIIPEFDPDITDPCTGRRVYDGACRQVSETEMNLDANGLPQAGSSAIDQGDYTHFDDYLPKTFWAYKYMSVPDCDCVGASRLSNKNALDIGAAEYDWRPTYSKDLASSRLTVTEASSAVYETADGKVAIPANSEISLEWALPTGAAGDIPCKFYADVPENAVLHVWRGETEILTIQSSSGYQTLTASETQNLRFVVKGSGEVILSDFSNSTTLTIVDPYGGISVDGAKIGQNDILPGQSLRLIISRNYQTRLTCAGILIDDEFFAFSGESEDLVFDRRFSSRDEPYTITAVYPAYNDWYVDAVNGSDILNDGRVKYRPLRTLAKVMQLSLMTSGDVVHAAPGLYADGLDKVSNSGTTNRVCVRAGVTLVSDEGPLETTIEGAFDNATTLNGPSAVRCCYLQSDAIIKGFTLRNGAVTQDNSSTAYGDVGGGAAGSGYVVDCVISNCWAIRGGGARDVTLVRCHLLNNGVRGYKSGASCSGPNLFSCNCFNCHFSVNQCYIGQGAQVAVNCTFEDMAPTGIKNSGSVWQSCFNSIVESTPASLWFGRCVVRTELPSSTNNTDGTCLFGVTNAFTQLDADLRPPKTSELTDRGVLYYYTNYFPKAISEEMDFDFAGGQRIYNDAIDIGCGEYDWRTDYRDTLSSLHYLTVTEASSRVKQGASAVVLNGTSSLTLNWQIDARGDCCSFHTARSGTGTLTVTADGVEIQPDASGVYTFRTKAGGSTVKISHEGDGAVAISSFKGAHIGFQVQFF